MSELINDHVVILNALLNNADVTGVLMNNIWAGVNEPPPTYDVSNGPGLAFNRRSGFLDEENQMFYGSYQFQTWGATYVVVDKAFRVAVGHLLKTHSYFIQGVEVETAGQHGTDPATNWPFMIGYMSVIIRNDPDTLGGI